MARKAFSTTMQADTLKALKLYAVKHDRALNEVLEEAATVYLAQKAAEDPDAEFFSGRADDPLDDCLAAIERRLAAIKKRRA